MCGPSCALCSASLPRGQAACAHCPPRVEGCCGHSRLGSERLMLCAGWVLAGGSGSPTPRTPRDSSGSAPSTPHSGGGNILPHELVAQLNTMAGATPPTHVPTLLMPAAAVTEELQASRHRIRELEVSRRWLGRLHLCLCLSVSVHHYPIQIIPQTDRFVCLCLCLSPSPREERIEEEETADAMALPNELVCEISLNNDFRTGNAEVFSLSLSLSLS